MKQNGRELALTFSSFFKHLQPFLKSWENSQNRGKVKANPYHFGQFWLVFQLFKNGSKTKVYPL